MGRQREGTGDGPLGGGAVLAGGYIIDNYNNEVGGRRNAGELVKVTTAMIHRSQRRNHEF